jgi:sec-independent protein translocase protein TatA
MGGLSITHLLILLAVVVLIFGTKKLRNLGSDLGGAVKGFKDGVKDDAKPSEIENKPAEKGVVIDAEAKDKQK